jgi:hypothetical protein
MQSRRFGQILFLAQQRSKAHTVLFKTEADIDLIFLEESQRITVSEQFLPCYTLNHTLRLLQGLGISSYELNLCFFYADEHERRQPSFRPQYV